MADQPEAKLDNIIKLAIMAVGGQGGGVLTNWIVDLAEANGYAVQATSVAGVAQRTGATIYYVEMCQDTGRRPVFSLAPAQGHSMQIRPQDRESVRLPHSLDATNNPAPVPDSNAQPSGGLKEDF